MTHLEETLQRDIQLIRAKILEMGNLGAAALSNSLQALLENNRQLAYAVILRDQWIDDAEKKLDRLCLEFLVRQTPAGAHLRFVYAALKINNELERIGDYAESIARQVLKISSLQPRPNFDKFQALAQLSIQMLQQTLEAFLGQDAAKAQESMKMEDVADDLRNEINAQLLALREENKIPLEALNPLMTIARRYERVSDQAKNICEEVLYMCTGEYTKHKGTDVFRVLFLDEGNSCRSQMAEGIARNLGLAGFEFYSAGTNPRGIDEKTTRFLKEKGIDISGRQSKPLSSIENLEYFQAIIVLNKGAESALPKNLSKTLVLDWYINDPTRTPGSAEDIQKVYEETFSFIRSHIQDLTNAILGNQPK